MNVRSDWEVAVVTGAGGERGIGRAIAERLAREGADVAVSDVVDEPHEAWGGLTAVKEGIEKGGRRSIAVTADVTDSGQVEVMFDRVVGELGRVDILVNNAGALAGKDRVPVVELEEALWDHVMTVNTKGDTVIDRTKRDQIQRNRETASCHTIYLTTVRQSLSLSLFSETY